MINTMKDKSLCGLIKFHSARLSEIAKDTEELQASIDDEVAEAYQQGFEDGKKEAESSDFIENLQANAFNKGMLCKSERIHEAYQRGLNEAWEAARKVVLNPDEGGTSLSDFFAIFGDESMQRVFRNYSASETIAKLKGHEEKQKIEDKIEVGDEVKRKLASENDTRGIVTKEWGDIYYIMWPDGSSGKWYKDHIVKTGRHFDIKGFLEEMRK